MKDPRATILERLVNGPPQPTPPSSPRVNPNLGLRSLGEADSQTLTAERRYGLTTSSDAGWAVVKRGVSNMLSWKEDSGHGCRPYDLWVLGLDGFDNLHHSLLLVLGRRLVSQPTQLICEPIHH